MADASADQQDAPRSHIPALLNRARRGDELALSALLEHYRDYLLLIANQDLDARLQAKLGPSDVVQRSMILAHAGFDRFAGDTEAEWRAWLRTIVKNDLLKNRRDFQRRKRTTDREIEIESEPALGRSLMDNQLTPSSEALAREKSYALKAALSRLTATQQQIIQLRNTERLSFAEIGQLTGRSADSARKFWARTIETLRSLIKQELPGLSDDSIQGGDR